MDKQNREDTDKDTGESLEDSPESIFLTQREVDELSKTWGGQNELVSVMKRSSVPKAKDLIFALSKSDLLRQIEPGYMGRGIPPSPVPDIYKTFPEGHPLEGVQYDKMLEIMASIQGVAQNLDPVVISETGKSEMERLKSAAHRQIEEQLPRYLLKETSRAFARIKYERSDFDHNELMVAIGIPMDAIWRVRLPMEAMLRGGENACRYHVFIAPRYKYLPEPTMFERLEKLTGKRFLPESVNFSADKTERLEMDSCYLAMGYITIKEDEEGRKKGIFSGGTHWFKACHRTILEKCKEQIRGELGLDSLDFKYRF